MNIQVLFRRVLLLVFTVAITGTVTQTAQALTPADIVLSGNPAFFQTITLTTSLSTNVPSGGTVAFYQTDSAGANQVFLGQITNVLSSSASMTLTPPAANVTTTKYFRTAFRINATETWSAVISSQGYYNYGYTDDYVIYNGSTKPLALTTSQSSGFDSTYYNQYCTSGTLNPGNFLALCSHMYVNLCIEGKPVRRLQPGGALGQWLMPSGTIQINDFRGFIVYGISDGYQTISLGYGTPAFILLGSFSTNKVPPLVSISSPSPEKSFTNGINATINVQSSVIAPQVPITTLRILVDEAALAVTNSSALVGTPTLAVPVPVGSHTLVAEVTDANGVVVRSTSQGIMVF